MREKDLERRLTQGVKKLGGKAYKFVSPGNAGVPDRLLVMPGGRVAFVELKAADGRLSPCQKIRIAELKRLGADVEVLRGLEDVDRFLRERHLRPEKETEGDL